MITPINIEEYMSIIASKYQNMPEGKEKENLWLEIKKIAEKNYPIITIEDLTNDTEINTYENE